MYILCYLMWIVAAISILIAGSLIFSKSSRKVFSGQLTNNLNNSSGQLSPDSTINIARIFALPILGAGIVFTITGIVSIKTHGVTSWLIYLVGAIVGGFLLYFASTTTATNVKTAETETSGCASGCCGGCGDKNNICGSSAING